MSNGQKKTVPSAKGYMLAGPIRALSSWPARAVECVKRTEAELVVAAKRAAEKNQPISLDVLRDILQPEMLHATRVNEIKASRASDILMLALAKGVPYCLEMFRQFWETGLTPANEAGVMRLEHERPFCNTYQSIAVLPWNGEHDNGHSAYLICQMAALFGWFKILEIDASYYQGEIEITEA